MPLQITDWHDPKWNYFVHAWIESQLKNHNITITGTIEAIHERSWSKVLRVPTSQGNIFFKASVAILAHEAELNSYLAHLHYDNLPRVIAVDTTQGWTLMRDGGKTLRENLTAQPAMQRWEELLPLYAKVQIGFSEHLEQFKWIGVPDTRLQHMPQIFEKILTEKHRFRIDMEDGITTAQYQQLEDLVPIIKQKCDALASYKIPESLHHGDLHDGNIFYNDGKYTFFDWGDSTITHPFFSLRTAYVSAEIRFNLEENAPVLNRLRDAYLVAWREYEPEARLLEAFGLAQELWTISSMFNWHRTISNLAESQQADYQHVIPALSEELLSLIKG